MWCASSTTRRRLRRWRRSWVQTASVSRYSAARFSSGGRPSRLAQVPDHDAAGEVALGPAAEQPPVFAVGVQPQAEGQAPGQADRGPSSGPAGSSVNRRRAPPGWPQGPLWRARQSLRERQPGRQDLLDVGQRRRRPAMGRRSSAMPRGRRPGGWRGRPGCARPGQLAAPSRSAGRSASSPPRCARRPAAAAGRAGPGRDRPAAGRAG